MTSQKPAHGAVPKGDVSYLRATPGPQFPVAPSPLPALESNHVPVAPQQHNVNSDLEDKLELQQRELEEIRARASQMEKTMRWWSDCTSNWREKWSKVRNERNKAREENRQLRAKLDLCIKEINSLKREREGLVNTSKDNDKSKVTDKQIELSDDSKTTSSNSLDSVQSKCELQSTSAQTEPFVQPSANSPQAEAKPTKESTTGVRSDVSKSPECSETIAGDKLALLELKLEESQKTITAEREEKSQLAKSLETMRHDVNSWKSKYEEQNQIKHDLEVQVRKLKDQHEEELCRVSSDLQDEQSSRSTVDKRLSELRLELERLQKENADEWGKRERMETEKLALERENKKLRTQISDLEEQLERKSTHASTVTNKDIKTLQMEVSEKNKELADLKHVHTKLKKTLQERLTDLEHSKRRCDQFEMEVKKLRSRVEELKRELAMAEDEVDTQANNVRKVQRNSDELQEQIEKEFTARLWVTCRWPQVVQSGSSGS
ncbi:coiled-coil domain-containing protein 102A-like isoform X2 [Mercenaria mercenaria]|uniref:coiled-coil domain-containing protein 102A-like isoform X2 n=1 Tax=Mercenaria mercenaria TaxID=6596 RepID=UPI00234EA246|nr:coiled-coil domain-containing protein 102A-like isoform X2 [Mercenaria mercenaria]